MVNQGGIGGGVNAGYGVGALAGVGSQADAIRPAYEQQRHYDAQSANKPKELGFLDRIAGIRGGLDELHERLCAFGGRVTGGNPDVPRPGSGGGGPAQTGLHGELASAEERLRQCMQVLGAINQAF
jgi:hypothetical protein